MSSSPPSHLPSSSSSKAPLSGLKEQWSQLNELLPPSSDDNQIVSTSSPLLLEVSAIPRLKQVVDPTMPVKPTSALPQQALENTPRTRSTDSNTKAGYPLPDQGVQTYFANAQHDYSSSCDLQVACFLHAWFTMLAQALRPWQTDAEKYQHLCNLNRFKPVSHDDDLPEPLDCYPCNNHFKVISKLAVSNLPTVLKLVEGKASKSFQTPSYKTIFDVALWKPLLDLKEQLTAMSHHLHLGQAGVPVPPVLAKYKTLSFWLVLMSTSSSATYLVEHCSNFWDNVLFKLQGKEDFSTDNMAQCFSVMASRLALGLVPVHEGSGTLFGEQKLFINKTVDQHMGMVSRISNDASMYVNFPSEPMLAITASLIMFPVAIEECDKQVELEQKPVNPYSSILENFRTRCLMDLAIAGFKGMHGELASHITLIVAWDAAKCKELDVLEQQTKSDYAEVLTCVVPLKTILAGLADLDEANADELHQRVERVQQDGSSTCPALQ
ncbi:hypothetical protein NDA14_007100 [Ustilago hordei]|nr:hypothetical protein NDA14_007100 [Ustilago hordei]